VRAGGSSGRGSTAVGEDQRTADYMSMGTVGECLEVMVTARVCGSGFCRREVAGRVCGCGLARRERWRLGPGYSEPKYSFLTSTGLRTLLFRTHNRRTWLICFRSHPGLLQILPCRNVVGTLVRTAPATSRPPTRETTAHCPAIIQSFRLHKGAWHTKIESASQNLHVASRTRRSHRVAV
jgi:hypothetical protein